MEEMNEMIIFNRTETINIHLGKAREFLLAYTYEIEEVISSINAMIADMEGVANGDVPKPIRKRAKAILRSFKETKAMFEESVKSCSLLTDALRDGMKDS